MISFSGWKMTGDMFVYIGTIFACWVIKDVGHYFNKIHDKAVPIIINVRMPNYGPTSVAYSIFPNQKHWRLEAFQTKPDIKHQLTNGITGLPIQYIEHNQIGTSQREWNIAKGMDNLQVIKQERGLRKVIQQHPVPARAQQNSFTTIYLTKY